MMVNIPFPNQPLFSAHSEAWCAFSKQLAAWMPPSFDLLVGVGTGGGKAPRINALALRLRRRRSFWGFGGEAHNSKMVKFSTDVAR